MSRTASRTLIAKGLRMLARAGAVEIVHAAEIVAGAAVDVPEAVVADVVVGVADAAVAVAADGTAADTVATVAAEAGTRTLLPRIFTDSHG